MARYPVKYQVQITFEAPVLWTALNLTHRLPGRAASIRLHGSRGLVAVSASRISAESPAEAVLAVVQATQECWARSPNGVGPLTMRSWTARRDRVLIGSRRSSGGQTNWAGDPRSVRIWPWHDSENGDDGEDGGGSAGVREPRRPLPGPGSLHAAVDLPRTGG